jgi:putative transposase
VQELVEQQGCSVQMACASLGLARSTYYYRLQRRDENPLGAAVEALVGQFPTYGTRRITHQLRRAPYFYGINRKCVQRIMRQKGLLRRLKRVKYRTTDSQHAYVRYPNLVRNLEIDRPERVWVCDITYIQLQHTFVFLAVVMDVFTRAIRGWNLGRSLDADLSLGALQRALCVCQPDIHHSDQGVQYACQAYTDVLKQSGIQISMAAQGQPEENGYAERLMRTLKEEEVDLSDYQDYADAQQQMGRFLEDVYMTKRIHSALGYLTPTEFEAAWRLAQAQPDTP